MEIFNVEYARDLTKQAQKQILASFVQEIKTEIERAATNGYTGITTSFPANMNNKDKQTILDELRNKKFKVFTFPDSLCFTINW